MAGLLDAFNDPQFQRGLMMFAASMPMSEQQRAGLLSYMDNQEQAKLQREYLGLQMESQRGQNEANRAKTAAAQAKLDFDNQLFGSLMGGGRPQGAGFAPGSVAQDGSRPNPATGGGFIASLTPDQLAALKIRGHDLTNVWEQTRPDMQVSNGYAYDKRNLGAGFMPSLQTTADGKSTMTQIGPDGLPVVSDPRGAVDTYGAYKRVDHLLGKDMEAFRNRSAAEWAGQEVIDPQTGRKVLTSRANALGRGGNSSVGYTGDPYTDAVMHTESRGKPNAVSPAGAQGTMQTMPGTLRDPGFGVTPARDNSPAELQRVGVEYLGKMNERYGDPAIAAVAYNWGPSNADKWLAEGGDFRKLPKETQDYVGQVMLRTGINRTQGVGQPQNVVGFSPQEEAQQEANRVRLTTQAKADVTPSAEKLGRYDSAANAISLIDQALSHPGLKAATGLSGSIDPRNYIPGTDAKNFGVLMDQIQGGAFMQAFQSLKGGGQITEREGEKAQAAIARMNRAQSTDEFTRGLNEYREVLSIGMERARKSIGGGQAQAEASPSRPANQGPPPRAMKGMVVDGYKFKGGNPADPSNWERQ